MPKTDEITKDILSLFDKIKEQAALYNHSFELIEDKKNEFSKLVDELNMFIYQMKLENHDLVRKYTSRYKELQSYIQQNYDKLKKEYSEIKNFNQLLQEHQEAVEELEIFRYESEHEFENHIKDIEEFKLNFDRSLEKYKNKAEKSIKKILEDSNEKIEARLDEKIGKLRDDIVFRQKRIEGLLLSYEQELKDLQREVTASKNELLIKINEITDHLEQEETVSIEDLSVQTDHMFLKMDEFKDRLDTIDEKQENLLNNLGQSSETNPGTDKNMNISITDSPDLSKLKIAVTKLKSDLDETENKLKTVSTVAYISIGICLIAVILAVL